MTTEAPPAALSPSLEERMARIEAQQEIIIELLKNQDAKIDALDQKFDTKIDTVNVRIDTTNHRIFLAGLGLFTIVGAGVVTYVVNLLV